MEGKESKQRSNLTAGNQTRDLLNRRPVLFKDLLGDPKSDTKPTTHSKVHHHML